MLEFVIKGEMKEIHAALTTHSRLKPSIVSHRHLETSLASHDPLYNDLEQMIVTIIGTIDFNSNIKPRRDKVTVWKKNGR